MGSTFEFDEFAFDVDNQELRRAGVVTKADGLLLRLLEAFVRSPGQLITPAAEPAPPVPLPPPTMPDAPAAPLPPG